MKMFPLKVISIIGSTLASHGCRNLYLTSTTRLDRKWREDKGLPENPNSYGPLTNFPDFTYMDGRPTPMGSNQKRRLVRQREIAEKMVTMCKELDFAKERHARLKAEKEATCKNMLENKLKPKGHLLLKSTK